MLTIRRELTSASALIAASCSRSRRATPASSTSAWTSAGLLMAAVVLLAAPSSAWGQGVPYIRRVNPPTLSKPTGYTQVVEVTGGRTIYISGQVAFDSAGRLVGAGDFRAQTTQVFENLRRALTSVGATFNDVVKMNIYSTDATQVAVLRDVRSAYFEGDRVPASTFATVPALARPEWLIEIEVIAVVR